MKTITKDQIEVYSSFAVGHRDYHVIYKNGKNMFEGDIKIATGEHGGETYPYVDYIEWEYDVEPENNDEVEAFIESNLNDYLNNAEYIG